MSEEQGEQPCTCWVSEALAYIHSPLGVNKHGPNDGFASNTTPFVLCYGRHPATPFSRSLPKSGHVPAADTYISGLQSAMRAAKQAVNNAQAQQAIAANKHTSADIPYQVGDLVLLNNQNLSLHVACPKLSGLFSGPFAVSARQTDGVNVTLELPKTWQMHSVFHQSSVKPFYGNPPDEVLPGLTPNPDDDPEVLEIEAITGRRLVLKKKKKQVEYLVKWKGYPEADNIWQPAETMTHASDLIAAFESCTRCKRVMK